MHPWSRKAKKAGGVVNEEQDSSGRFCTGSLGSCPGDPSEWRAFSATFPLATALAAGSVFPITEIWGQFRFPAA